MHRPNTRRPAHPQPVFPTASPDGLEHKFSRIFPAPDTPAEPPVSSGNRSTPVTFDPPKQPSIV